MRQWTEHQRQQAAERARLYRPWASSTGPRTALGKYRASRNSLKHGRFTYEKKILRWYLRLSVMRLKQLKTHLAYQNYKRENELIAKWSLKGAFKPDRMAYYPYFKVHPLNSKSKRVKHPTPRSQHQEIFDFFTSLSGE